MKKLKRLARKEKRSGRNGAKRDPNRPRDRDGNSSIRRRRHPKTELEAAIQRFVDLYDFAPIAYVSFDRAGRIEEANLAATELLGEPRDLLIGRPFAFYVADLDAFLQHLLNCRTSEQKVKTELRLKTRKGARIPAELLSTPITSTTRNGALLYQTAIMDLSERKRAEEALRAKEAELEAIINRTPFMLSRCTRDLRYRFVSRAYAQMLRQTPEEIADKPIVEIMGEEGLKTILPQVKKVLKGQRVEYETEVSFRGVGAPCLHCVYTPDWDSNGNVIGWFASIADVTARKRAEHRLAVNLAVSKILAEAPALDDAAPRLLQTLCETLGWELGDFWTLAPEADELRCLKVWEQSVGRFPRFRAMSCQHALAHGIGLPGRVWSSLKPAWIPDVTKDNNFSRASIAAREGLHGAFAFPIFFGKQFLAVMEFFSRKIREPDEDLLRMFASIGSQIGQFMERKRAEERFRRVVELAPSAMIMANERGRIILSNAVAEKLFGYTRSELSKTTVEQLIPKRFRRQHPGFRAGFYARPKHRAMGAGRYLYALARDGTEVPVEIDLSPIRTEGGNYVLASVVDLTERKRAESALRQSKEMLEERVRERTHELDTANIELRKEIELRKGLEGEILAVSDREQQRLGQELHDGVCQHLTGVAFMARSIALRLKNHRVIDAADIEKIAQLVNDAATDMRNLSRALHRSDVDAAKLIAALQDLVDREIWRTPCRLEVRPSFHLEDDAAAAQLYRIAREAVINANKHAQAREIVVRVERLPQRGLALRIIDNGVGFANGTTPSRGLGCHIMKYRAELMGGRLEIDSPKGGGTRVSCYLPGITSKLSKTQHSLADEVPKSLGGGSVQS